MAKTSKITKNDRRRATVARWEQRRTTAKETLRAPGSSDADRAAAHRVLQRMPRDASPVRVRNRDAVDGRPRGYLRKFGLSRIRMREMAHDGQLPGVRKASW